MTPEPTPPSAAPAQQVLPQPLPTQVTVTLVQVTAPGQPTRHLLRWDIITPAGTQTIFSDRPFTQQIVQMLMQHLQAWPGELVVAQPDLDQVRALLGHPNGKQGGGR
jgi:hypothetical protein